MSVTVTSEDARRLSLSTSIVSLATYFWTALKTIYNSKEAHHVTAHSRTNVLTQMTFSKALKLKRCKNDRLINVENTQRPFWYDNRPLKPVNNHINTKQQTLYRVFFPNRPSQQRKANCTIRTHGYLSNEATLFFSFVCVLFRWSWPGHTRGCGSRRRIWCSKQTAWRGLDRWPGPFSSLLYLSRTPPAYPQGSLSPLRVYGLQAADVYSLWKQRNDFTLKI